MPLLLSKRISPHSTYAIWNITESIRQLHELIKDAPPKATPNKQSEWIVTRVLAKYLCQHHGLPYSGVANKESGQPFLIDQPAYISITHSFPLAGVILDMKKPCGIDLEWPRQKLTRVQSKFLHDSEEKHKNNVPDLCKIWVSKEVLFKIYGEKALSMKDETYVKLSDSGMVKGKILKPGFDAEINIALEEVQGHVLGYSC